MGSFDGPPRRIVQIVRRKKRQQLPQQQQALLIVVRQKMRHAALAVMRQRAAELFLGDFFVGDRLDHVRSGHEHVAGLVDHRDEVRDCRRIHGAARARPHDRGNLRDHSGSQRVAKKDVGITAERSNAFLDPRAAGIVQADDRRAHLHGEVHDLADFLCVGFAEGTAEDREVLGKDIDQAAVDAAVSGNDAVAGKLLFGHAEVETAVFDELVEFFEGVLVEKNGDALARRHFAVGLLPIEPVLSAAQFCSAVALGELLDAVGRRDASHYLMTGTFSQSFRNCSTPRSVSGCFSICSKTFVGSVQTSAPSRPA